MKRIAVVFSAALVVLATGCPAETKTKTKKRSRSSSSSSDADWPGTFIGARLSISIEKAKADDDAVKGTITQGAQRFSFTGTTSGDSLDGTFSAGDSKFELTATLDEDKLSLETGGKTYALKRKKVENPLGDGKNPPGGNAKNPLGGGALSPGGMPATNPPITPPTKSAPGGALSPGGMPSTNPHITPPAGSAWRPFTHKGFTLRYPPSWATKSASADTMMLIPPDQTKDAQGKPSEAYVVRGVPSQGAKRADEPRAITFFDQQMRQAFPTMKRVGQPKALPRGAVEITYGGKHPQTGKQVVASLRVIIFEGFAFMFFAIAEQAQLQKRTQLVAQIFGTFGFSQPKNDDPRLVGAWRNTRTYMSGKFSSVTERYLLLTADGRCYGGGQFAASMEHTGPSGRRAGSSSLGTGDKKGWEYSGRWFAASRSLTLNWSNGNREYYGYYICNGQDLLLRQSKRQKKGGLLFKRYR